MDSWKQEYAELKAKCAEEIENAVLETLQRSMKTEYAYREWGGKFDPWMSVGLMCDHLRQSASWWIGETFSKLTTKSQNQVVRKVLESLAKKGKVDQATGFFDGRECKQYRSVV